jgi:hypothetical protein
MYLGDRWSLFHLGETRLRAYGDARWRGEHWLEIPRGDCGFSDG